MVGDLFLMSAPGANFRLRGRANFRSEGAEQVDAAGARREWEALRNVIETQGGRVVVLPSDDELTGLPYAAEAGHPLPARDGERPRFLLPRMAAAHRQGEARLWKPFVEALGFSTIELSEGTWEGQGDVADFRGVSLLFFGGRSSRRGMEGARAHFDGETLVLELEQPAFHGNMALLPLPAADKLLACPDVIVGDGIQRLQKRFGADCIVPVTKDEICAYATNGLPIGDTWIAPSVAPRRVVDLVRGFGISAMLLEMRELCEKAGGASRCLVCRVPADIAP